MLISRRRIWLDRIQTIRLYYSKPRFALVDILFGVIALFVNPYRTCRKYLEKRGADNVHAYGETPFTTYQRLAEQCGIGPQDIWLEMGAGRGKGCFWLAQFVGCKVIGIEWIPQFVRVANFLKSLFRIQTVQFECNDMEKVDLKGATVIYLYGNWPQFKIPAGVKIITISEPLEGYQVLKSFWVRYPWGRTTAFLHKLT